MKKLLKLITFVCFILAMPLNVIAGYVSDIGITIAEDKSGIYLDGIYMGHDGEGAFIGENNEIMIPARWIDLYVNGSYNESDIIWDDVNKEFTATRNDNEEVIQFKASKGKFNIKVNGKAFEQKNANIIKNNRLYIPLEGALKYSKNGSGKISYVDGNAITNITKAKDIFRFLAETGVNDDIVERYITENIDCNFKSDMFSKKYIYTDNGSDAERFIVYKYKIGDIETNFGYFVTIYNDSEIEISVIGKQLYMINEDNIVDENIKEEELKEKAVKLDNSNNTIVAQSVERHYAPIIGREVYDVTTTYSNGDIGYDTLNQFIIE